LPRFARNDVVVRDGVDGLSAMPLPAFALSRPHPSPRRELKEVRNKPNEVRPKSALSCSATIETAKALPLIEQGAAGSFSFGYFSLRKRKVTSTGWSKATAAPNEALKNHLAMSLCLPRVAALRSQ
jgi:hypothetical protein